MGRAGGGGEGWWKWGGLAEVRRAGGGEEGWWIV